MLHLLCVQVLHEGMLSCYHKYAPLALLFVELTPLYRCSGRYCSHQYFCGARCANAEGFLVVVPFFKQLKLSLAVSELEKQPYEVNVRCGSLRVRTAFCFRARHVASGVLCMCLIVYG